MNSSYTPAMLAVLNRSTLKSSSQTVAWTLRNSRTLPGSESSLDNVVDLTRFPVERVDQMFKNNSRIGLGIMGFADILFLMALP